MDTQEISGRSGARAGFTLIELMVSFSVMLVVLLGFSRLLISSQMASNTTHEATLAKEAARGMVEILQATPFQQIYERYNSDPNDGGGAPVTIFQAGQGFRVPGPRLFDANDDDQDALKPPAGQACCGQILFPELNGNLTENLNVPQFGWVDLDLNGDGDHDDAAVAPGEYRFLPVVVRVSWSGASGLGSVEFKTLIANY